MGTKEETCKDCGLDISYLDLEHYKCHPELCCDCWDEMHGMEPSERTFPRPKK